MVERGADSRIGLTNRAEGNRRVAAEFSLPAAEHGRRIVGGAVVDDNNFDRAIGLSLSGSECFFEKRGAVEGWDDDGGEAGPAGGVHPSVVAGGAIKSNAGVHHWI